MRALISVYDKKGISEFAKFLISQGFKIISTGGTLDYLKKQGVFAENISDTTGFPEILDGRVKTLHPKLHASLLFDRDNYRHVNSFKNLKFPVIDFVIVKAFPKWKIPFFLLKLFRGETHFSKYVEIIQSQNMKISANNTLLHLDGEPYKTSNPVEIKVIPKSLKILIPNGEE